MVTDSVRRDPGGGTLIATAAWSRVASVGVIAVLVAALAALGVAPTFMPDSYSWLEHGVSESAAQGVPGAWVARLGFLLFGLAVLELAHLRAAAWGRFGTALHVVFAVSMFGVAAFSAKSWVDTAAHVESEDTLHSVFATAMGFAFVVGVIAVMVARRLPSARRAVPDIAVVVVATAVPLAMSLAVWGLLQRLMFVAAALWYSREALAVRSRASRPDSMVSGSSTA